MEPASSSLADTPSDAEFVRTHSPIYTEVGLASWYGPPYNHRRGANGQIYDENALTAAHRTLPLNSLVRVTNLKTGQSAIVRITDRGPFVPGRMLDLSLATAKAVGVWRAGVAKVRMDVYGAPGETAAAGRWCVQIGPFRGQRSAVALRNSLARKYPNARVLEFAGPTGHWVRIFPASDDRSQAAALAEQVQPREGKAYLVRLD
jgi:rare lipoprotein A